MKEIKRCGICNSPAVLNTYFSVREHGITYTVSCPHCDIETKEYATQQGAIKAWEKQFPSLFDFT